LQQLRLLAINISDPAGATPLLHAAKHGHAQLAELLLQAGASSSPQLHPSLNMPLHLACLHGHLDVVRALLSYKADANARNAAGDTPLMFACSGGHLAVALTLLHKVGLERG
jgi:ankyrin repeat protein